ncbi:MAG: FecR domain-containing protein [Pseudomonadota bacterium]
MTETTHRKRRPDTEEMLEVAHKWALRLETPGATINDHRDFERWLQINPQHRDIYDQVLTFRAGLAALTKDDLDADIVEHSNTEKLTSFLDGIQERALNFHFQVAAGFLMVVLASAFFLDTFLSRPKPLVETAPVLAEYSSAIGETKTFTLSDGTAVTLGAASSINVLLSSEQRVIELISGAVFFDVASDKARPFSVSAGPLTATALGTEFEVRHGASGYKVAVAEGAVEVSYPFTMDGAPTSLRHRKMVTAGEQLAATNDNGLQSVREVEIGQIGAWREDRLVYTGDTLAEAIFDANRYSSVPIKISEGQEAIGAYRLRGVFFGSDIDRLLSSITLLHPVEIDRSNPGVIFVRQKQDT